VLAGMVLIGVGTFFAQAAATGFVSATATSERGSASGIYLACYFAGGMAGTAILGWIFDPLSEWRPASRASASRSWLAACWRHD
jgi:MFS family permease